MKDLKGLWQITQQKALDFIFGEEGTGLPPYQKSLPAPAAATSETKTLDHQRELEIQYGQLHSEFIRLQQKKQSAEKEWLEAQQSFQQQLGELRDRLAKAEGQRQRLYQECDNLTLKMQQADQFKQELEEAQVFLTQKNDDLTYQLQKMEVENAKLRNSLAALQQAEQSASEQAANPSIQLKQQNNQLQHKLQLQDIELKRQQQLNEELREQLQQHPQSGTASAEDLLNLQEQLRELQQRHEALGNELEYQRELNEQLQQQYNQLELQRDDLYEQLAARSIDSMDSMALPMEAFGDHPVPQPLPVPPEEPVADEVLFQEPFDPQEEVLRLVRDEAELRALYDTLGFSLDLEFECQQRLDFMMQMIVAEIPDFPAFLKALETIQAQFNNQEKGMYSQQFLEKARFHSEDNNLLNEVLAAGDDQALVLELINRNPVHGPLPFVEQLPFQSRGDIVWRTPIELSIIRKRPANQTEFEHNLDEIERMVSQSRLPRPEQKRKDLQDVISRVRRDLKRENAYIPTSLKLLQCRLDDWLKSHKSREAHKRRETLDQLLLELVNVRHDYGQRKNSELLPKQAVRVYKRTTHRQAKAYLESTWMHTPWLTTWLLSAMLDAELCALQDAGKDLFSGPIEALRLIYNEVESGYYDSDETIRHLRNEEEKGLYISSLIYALLRLNRSAASLMERKKMIDDLADAIEKGELF